MVLQEIDTSVVEGAGSAGASPPLAAAASGLGYLGYWKQQIAAIDQHFADNTVFENEAGYLAHNLEEIG